MVDLPVTLLCGEVQKAVFHFKNIGQICMKNLHVICSQPNYFSYGKQINNNNDKVNMLNSSNINYNLEACENGKQAVRINSKSPLCNNDVIRIPLDDDRLMPNAEIMLPVYVYGVQTPGVHEINFIFYYEPEEIIKEVPYRLVQQMIRIQTLSSLTMSVSTRSINGNVPSNDNIIKGFHHK